MLFRLYVRWKLRGLPVKAWRVQGHTTAAGFETWQWVCETKSGDRYRSTSTYASRWDTADRMRSGLRQALRKNTKQKAYGNMKADE